MKSKAIASLMGILPIFWGFAQISWEFMPYS